MNASLRVGLLSVCLLPYLYFGIRDVIHHGRHRNVALDERLLHIALGVMLAIILPHAFMGNYVVVIPGLFLFVLARLLDEFVYHRRVRPEEVDLHAKTHFGFMVFVVGVLGARQLGL